MASPGSGATEQSSRYIARRRLGPANEVRGPAAGIRSAPVTLADTAPAVDTGNQRHAYDGDDELDQQLRSLATALAAYDGAAELDEGLTIVLAGLRSQLRA